MVTVAVLSVVAMHLLEPRQAHAQSTQGDVRASSFTLVGPDGTVLATLAPGAQGNGHLTLFNATGVRTVSVEGGSAEGGAGVALYDAEGHPRVQLFYSIQNGYASLRVLGTMANHGPRCRMARHRAVRKQAPSSSMTRAGIHVPASAHAARMAATP